MDLIKQSGGEPANFLDVGGTADAKRVEQLKFEFDVPEIHVIYMCEFERDYEHKTGKHHLLYETFLQENPHFNLSRKKLSEKDS